MNDVIATLHDVTAILHDVTATLRDVVTILHDVTGRSPFIGYAWKQCACVQCNLEAFDDMVQTASKRGLRGNASLFLIS